MNQPRFTWWPWRFLAIVSPLLALGGAVLADSEHRPPREVFGIFFSVLAAANGYMFAMAVGDFGRSILAIPIGAIAGYAAVLLFSFAVPNTIFVVFLFIVAGLSVATRMMKAFSGCMMMIFLFFAFIAFIEAFYRRSSSVSEPPMCFFSSYPFVCGCVAAALPLENSMLAIFQAGLAGIRAAMNGMVTGGIVALGIGFLAAVMSGFRVSRRTEQIIASVFVCVCAAAINYFCVQNIFTAVHRAEGEEKDEPAETEALIEEPDADTKT